MCTDEVGLEWRTEWIAFPCATIYFFTSLVCDGVIDGDYQRFIWGKIIDQAIADSSKQNGFVHAFFEVESVISCPVRMLAPFGANDVGECAFGRAVKSFCTRGPNVFPLAKTFLPYRSPRFGKREAAYCKIENGFSYRMTESKRSEEHPRDSA